MSARFEIDWVACDGHGLCAGVVPELIDLDDWGYPLIARGEVPDELVPRARQAAAACPALALKVVRAHVEGAERRTTRRALLVERASSLQD